MTTRPRELREYQTAEGRFPFSEWIEGLRDVRGRAILRKRLNRIRLGNLGDCRSVGHGIRELRVDFGPGYRIYFGEDGDTVVILLCGGDKSSQPADIRRAQTFWADYWS